MNRGNVPISKEVELEIKREDLIRRIERLIEMGEAERAKELSREASKISKELESYKDIDLVRSEAGKSSEENPTYLNAELERKRLLNEVAPLVRSGSIEDAMEKIEEAVKLTNELKKQKEELIPRYNVDSGFSGINNLFNNKNEIVVRKNVPEVPFPEKVFSAAVLPHKGMGYVTDNPFFEDAVLIVGISAILTVLSKIFNYQISSYAEVVSTIAYVYTLWLIISALSQMVASVFGVDGELHPQMTTIVGYSTIPVSIGFALTTFFPYNEIIILSLAWSAVILTYGIKRARYLSTSRSMIAACPLVLWLFLLL
ncbi:MAG: YIP1 family protein [Halobacteriota archaeon]|nr:YIP1 family protein [Halobacteriota archaeon]